jgi:hypothetical protein
MLAEVGRILLAFGPWGAVMIFACLMLALLGTTWIIWVVRRLKITEGEIRIQALGICVRWRNLPEGNDHLAEITSGKRTSHGGRHARP